VNTKRCPCPDHEGPNPLPVDEFYTSHSRPDGLAGWCKVCTNRVNRENSRRWRQENPDRERENSRRARQAARDAVLDHYGRVCACPGCGATKRLTIDHVNGDGKAHRIALFGYNAESYRMYRWLIEQGFPDGFQVLCGPCNSSKKNGQACHLNHTAPSS
jgi:hypothetical protein